MIGTNAPVELLPIDISAHAAGNTGVDYVHRLEGPAPGPTVMINALTHGNEICGALAVDFLLRQGPPVRRGTLILGFANVAAFENFDANNPTASRFVNEDFNRIWSTAILDGAGDSVERRRARALRPFVEAADYLLDIHSMQQAGEPLLLAGMAASSLELARRLGYPSIVICDRGHQSGVRLRDYGAFATGEKAALLVECGQHWSGETGRVAIETALRFLLALGTVDEGDVAGDLPRRPVTAPTVIEVTDRVTITSERFRFARDFANLTRIAKAGTLIARDGGARVETPYDDCILVMPSKHLPPGQTAVRFGRIAA